MFIQVRDGSWLNISEIVRAKKSSVPERIELELRNGDVEIASTHDWANSIPRQVIAAAPGWKVIKLRDDGTTDQFEIIGWALGEEIPSPITAADGIADDYEIVLSPSGVVHNQGDSDFVDLESCLNDVKRRPKSAS